MKMQKRHEQFINYLLSNPEKVVFDMSDPVHCKIHENKIRISYGARTMNRDEYPVLIFNCNESFYITPKVRDDLAKIFEAAKTKSGFMSIDGFVNKYCNNV